MIMIFLGEPLKNVIETLGEPSAPQVSPPSTPSIASSFLKKVTEHRGNKCSSAKPRISWGSYEFSLIVDLTALYHIALVTLTQLRLDILTGE